MKTRWQRSYEWPALPSSWTCEPRTVIPDRTALFAFIRGHLRSFASPSSFTHPTQPCDAVKEELTRMNANAAQMNANRPELEAISNQAIGCAVTVATSDTTLENIP